ncbi:hypothetical protein [Streptomyces phaeochromogenes]|uniref:hypothetical protein n=1 Tax=Streptomyces phaeochromogenes TaxID=1923 RepID=UPI0033E2C8C4
MLLLDSLRRGTRDHGHLAAPGVVDAEEEHGGLAIGDVAFELRQGVQALAGEAFGQERLVFGDGSAADELVVVGGQEPLGWL